jgi:ubiquinone/menaquinone biosynthesis C-methylase UbiE
LLAAAHVPGIARIIDLGGGTGSLAEAILDRFPQTSVVVRDIDPEMLEVARTRLARFAGRVELSLGSFADPLPPADAVLSAFALHHISNLSQKAEVYRQIRQAMRPGSVILNNDAAGGPLWPFLRDQWAGFMVAKGFTMGQAYRDLDDWAAEDTYFFVYEELQIMVQAGFEHPVFLAAWPCHYCGSAGVEPSGTGTGLYLRTLAINCARRLGRGRIPQSCRVPFSRQVWTTATGNGLFLDVNYYRFPTNLLPSHS